MAQSTVFEQIIKLIPRTQFQSIVARHDADKFTRSMDSWTWFGALLFGQLTGHDSIRSIERIFAHSDSKMLKLGFGPVRKSTLADANQNRPIALLEDLFQWTLLQAQKLAPKKNGFRFAGQVLALDSTTIELCLSLCPWAKFHHDKGATKLHTAIDIAGDLPQFAIITDGRTHDVRAAKEQITFTKGTTVVCDRVSRLSMPWLLLERYYC